MPVLINISYLATCRAAGEQADLHGVEHAAVAWRGETIEWVGAEDALPEAFRQEERHDAGGRLVVPGLIDCHTHLAFAGWRDDEFTLRSLGRSYQEIARAGGGILRTVRSTRAASEEELLERAEKWIREMVSLGVTTVECKSGYGLSVDAEMKLLRVYGRLRRQVPIDLVPTFLGAHVVPTEHDRTTYVDLVCNEMIPAVADSDLAEYCDVFLEEGAFTVEEARRILETGTTHGLRPKLHADQLSDAGGARLAAEVGAASADHLEYAATDGIEAMAERGVVAVNLPIATLYLQQRPFPGRTFLEAGVSVAVATDFNPGSAPSFHLPLAMALACIRSGMTPAEVLKGATVVAARAAGREHVTGSIETGKRADFIVVDAESVDQWLYHFRPNAVLATFAAGDLVFSNR